MEVSHINKDGNRTQHKILARFRRRAQRLAQRTCRLVAELEQAKEQLKQAKQELQSQSLQIASLQTQIRAIQQHSRSLSLTPFSDSNVFQHRFAASMVALCVNLSRIMPLRTVPRTLEIILPALGIQTSIPDRETIIRWCKRLGLDRLMQNQKFNQLNNYNDMIWIVDHSNQIGTQKVLVVLGISASKLPAKGQTLSLDALEVLAIEPGRSWTRDDVRRVYKELAEKIGRPRWLLCDGAVELRESVDVLCDESHTTNVLRDFKHVAANRFESLIGKSERFGDFIAEMGKSRCLLQQTELAHLTPPGMKTKARFMNITPIIAWAKMVLGVLDNPRAEASGVQDVKKLKLRLGWVRGFAKSIASWQRCCEVINWSLAWINTQGLEPGTAEQMRSGLAKLQSDGCKLSEKMTKELLASVEQSCGSVTAGERSWLSSESLESVFGLYKRREGQQSRSGFTGLLLSIPTLLRSWSASEVREGLMRISTKESQAWIKDRIGSTVWSKRTRVYNHFNPKVRHDLQPA
jgi:hypothetical protein